MEESQPPGAGPGLAAKSQHCSHGQPLDFPGPNFLTSESGEQWLLVITANYNGLEEAPCKNFCLGPWPGPGRRCEQCVEGRWPQTDSAPCGLCGLSVPQARHLCIRDGDGPSL